jgi:hypothetical protein
VAEKGVQFAITSDSAKPSTDLHTSAYVSIRQHTSAYVSTRQHTSASVPSPSPAPRRALTSLPPAAPREVAQCCDSIRQHTSAYVSIRQHLSPPSSSQRSGAVL